MKLDKLCEDDTKLSRKQMLDWCNDNIIHFSEFDNYNTQSYYSSYHKLHL